MFWHVEKDINHKRQFVASHVKSAPIRRKRPKTRIRGDAREHTRHYYFEVNGTITTVCKTFFLNTLHISQTFVTTALKKKEAGGIIAIDERGRHDRHAKVPELVRQSVRDHIMKFPAEESHYSRERSKRKYLGTHLNLSKMYNLYKSECEENNLSENVIAKEWLYCEIFNTEFNLSFKPPDNDTCDKCDFFLVSLRDSQTAEGKNAINTEYEEHLSEASKRYNLKKKDKENALQNPVTQIMICVDLQKCLATPVLTNSQSFYSLKLWTYNYTLYNATNKKVTCMMWDESKSGRGANEMAFGMLKWALAAIKPQHEEIFIWSDNCPCQNRNIVMVMAYFWILKIFPTLKCINHKFLLRGHTHLEVDASHSLIEREKKKTMGFQIITPWDWQQLARMCSAKNPFEVENMEVEDFKDFKLLYGGSTSPFINRKTTESGEAFAISQIVHLQVRSDDEGVLYYKTDFDCPQFQKVNLKRTGRRIVFPKELTPIRCGLNPISTKKFEHLQKLLRWIPVSGHFPAEKIPPVNCPPVNCSPGKNPAR
ncbi:hypothetical protein RI129_008664 [Pyrocoelia pectoralis]|uniref:DUF7869 domain-containing protein n=1 Tax=Pyrocoelia pectoralis TaxID=417401 RepID=A0AAN7ZG78_9COLE